MNSERTVSRPARCGMAMAWVLLTAMLLVPVSAIARLATNQVRWRGIAARQGQALQACLNALDSANAAAAGVQAQNFRLSDGSRARFVTASAGGECVSALMDLSSRGVLSVALEYGSADREVLVRRRARAAAGPDERVDLLERLAAHRDALSGLAPEDLAAIERSGAFEQSPLP